MKSDEAASHCRGKPRARGHAYGVSINQSGAIRVISHRIRFRG
jgi:hypothetical protein